MTNDTENAWQPAILLPVERMCSLHKKLWDEFNNPIVKQEREDYVGKRVFIQVRPLDAVMDDNYIDLPSGNCTPYRIRYDESRIGGCFSCEISTD